MQRAVISIEWRKGRPFANISGDAQQDAIVDMLLEIQWPAGRMLQTISVMLDPPIGAMAPIAATQMLPATVLQPMTATEPASGRGTSPPTATKVIVPPPLPDDSLAVRETLTVKRGDTLLSLSRPLTTEGVSVEQVMASLFQDNTHAFINGNINRLKAGSILKTTRLQTGVVASEAAHRLVRAHLNDAGRNTNEEGSVKPSDDVAVTTNHHVASPVSRIAPTTAPPRAIDKLTLSAPGTNDGKTAAIPVKIAPSNNALEEDLIAARKAIVAERARSAELSSALNDAQTLLELKSRMLKEKTRLETGASVSAAASPVTSHLKTTSMVERIWSYLGAIGVIAALTSVMRLRKIRASKPMDDASQDRIDL